MDKELQKSSILIAGARGFLGKYLLREFSERHLPEEIITLGLNPENDIVCDLRRDIPEIPTTVTTVIDAVGACFGNRLRQDNIDTTRRLLEALSSNPPKRFVYFSTTDIFGKTEGENIDESTPKIPVTEIGRIKKEAEDMLVAWANEHNVLVTVLYCPSVVGTGMKGYPRRLVNSIYRGFYTHIKDNEASTSVVHATDVAQAALAAAPVGGHYIITDNQNPTRHDFAEALAYRLDNKRIFTISLKKAKNTARLIDMITFSRNRRNELKQELTTLTFSCKKLCEATGFQPVAVTDYLRTHVYDEKSL